MELYWDIQEMFKPSFLKCIYFKMPIDTSVKNKYRTKKVILRLAKNIVKNKPWRLQQDSNLQPHSL